MAACSSEGFLPISHELHSERTLASWSLPPNPDGPLSTQTISCKSHAECSCALTIQEVCPLSTIWEWVLNCIQPLSPISKEALQFQFPVDVLILRLVWKQLTKHPSHPSVLKAGGLQRYCLHTQTSVKPSRPIKIEEHSMREIRARGKCEWPQQRRHSSKKTECGLTNPWYNAITYRIKLMSDSNSLAPRKSRANSRSSSGHSGFLTLDSASRVNRGLVEDLVGSPQEASLFDLEMP